MKRFLAIDTETTNEGMVLDVALCGYKSKKLVPIGSQGYVIKEVWDRCLQGEDFLFCGGNGHFSRKSLDKRMAVYTKMLQTGKRKFISKEHLQTLFDLYLGQDYVFTAYNNPFDIGKLQNTGIVFPENFEQCDIWRTFQAYLQEHPTLLKKYWTTAVQNHHHKNNVLVTAHLTVRTNADTAARFVLGDNIPPEPHTALEDVRLYEIPVLRWLFARNAKIVNDGRDWAEMSLKNLMEI